jgi:methionyl aminopeptidase
MINIRSKHEIELMKQAGHINYLTHQELAKHIKPGITTGELNDIADKYMRKLGGKPSCLNYEGFPKSICISVNDEVVHGIPGKRIIKDGDVVSIDFCVEYQGYQSDSARTYIVGTASEDVQNLVKNTEKALYVGLGVIKEGTRINEIGKAIEDFAHEHGLSVVHELVGHGLGTDIHEEPDVPNFYTDLSRRLKAGMVIAVEPMLNLGQRYVYLENDGWTVKTIDKQPAAHFEHTIVVTEDGYEILTGE